MRKQITKKDIAEAITIAVLMGVAFFVGTVTIEPKEVEVIKYVEVQVEDTSTFDTDALELWCPGDEGTVRMIGGWYYGTAKDGGTIIEDESGCLWTVENTPIKEDDFLLLWIADNHTEDTRDDVIVKVWNEAHE